MSSIYQKAQYESSGNTLNTLPAELGFEIAFAGRSNSGKSSTINKLCRQKSLARTSKTPGRTQLINFFAIPDGRYLVDLPGYGYAKVPIKVKREWHQFIEAYMTKRWTLRGLVIVMDIRHPLKDDDWNMIQWAEGRSLSTHILLNKSDKFKRNAANQSLFSVKKAIAERVPDMDVSVQMFSATKGDGLPELERKLNEWLYPEEMKTS